MKVGYRTSMRFYRDSPEETEIVWYPVPENRPFIPYPHVFFSWDWVEPNSPGKRTPGGVGLGEQITATRRYPGRPLPRRTVFTGNFCGTKEEWLNGASLPVVAPPLMADGFPPCCGRVSVPFWDIYSCPDLAKMIECLRLQYTNNAATRAYLVEQFGDVWEFPLDVDNGGFLEPGMLIGVNPDWAIVVVSGTTHFNQYFRQALGSLTPGSMRTPLGNGYSTSGIYEDSATLCYRRVVANVPKGHQVLFIGHSYGGAVAQIAAVKVQDRTKGNPCWVATFGSPRAGDYRLTQLCRHKLTNIHNVVNDGDPVPRVPPWPNQTIRDAFPLVPWDLWLSWDDNAYRSGLRVDGTMYRNPSSYLTIGMYTYILSNLLTAGFDYAFSQHSPTEYRRRLLLNNCGGVPVAVPSPILLLTPDGIPPGAVGDHIAFWADESPLAHAVDAFDAFVPVVGAGVDGYRGVRLKMDTSAVISQMLITPQTYFGPTYSLFLAGRFGRIPPAAGLQFGPFLSDGLQTRKDRMTPSAVNPVLFNTTFPTGVDKSVWWVNRHVGDIEAGHSWGESFTALDPGAAMFQLAQIRCAFQAGQHWPDCEIYECRLYDGVLTDIQTQIVIGELRAKFPSLFLEP